MIRTFDNPGGGPRRGTIPLPAARCDLRSGGDDSLPEVGNGSVSENGIPKRNQADNSVVYGIDLPGLEL